jgi:hypothetical protein
MRKSTAAVVSACFLTGVAGLLLAQQEKRASPHEQTSATIGGKKITIEYGRPYKKGRTIFGGLVPFDKVWRTGADEATMLTTEADLMIGKLHVPAGSYSLFTVPGESKWTLIVNKVAKQWGAYKYEEAQNLGTTEMKAASGPAVEQFTISIEAQGDRKGTLKMAWDQTVATAPIIVH